MIDREHNVWARRAKRYRKRGTSGFGSSIARAEWQAAADLWNAEIKQTDGWTVDFGAGNGGFWRYVTPPHKLLLVDIIRLVRADSDHRWIIADGNLPPIRHESIECIVALGLLEYIQNIEHTLSNWHEIIKPGGKLLVSNSPPIMQNRLRRIFGFGAIPRPDSQVEETLRISGWRNLPSSPKYGGWQTIFVLEAI